MNDSCNVLRVRNMDNKHKNMAKSANFAAETWKDYYRKNKEYTGKRLYGYASNLGKKICYAKELDNTASLHDYVMLCMYSVCSIIMYYVTV